jgi:hypothetical protein
MSTKGYTLIYSTVHGNVVGAVIAPKGTENYPKDRRMFVWRAIIQPLVQEVAEHEEFPTGDMTRVVQDLQRFCIDEGLCLPVQDNSQGK